MFYGIETAIALLSFLFALAFTAVAIWQVIHNTICVVTSRMCRFIPIGDGMVFIFAAGVLFAIGKVFAS